MLSNVAQRYDFFEYVGKRSMHISGTVHEPCFYISLSVSEKDYFQLQRFVSSVFKRVFWILKRNAVCFLDDSGLFCHVFFCVIKIIVHYILTMESTRLHLPVFIFQQHFTMK